MSVSNPRIEVKDAAPAGWFGAREDANLPVRASGADPGAGTSRREAGPSDARAARRWWRLALRFVADLAVVLAAMTAIPVIGVVVNDGWHSSHSMSVGDTREKLLAIEPSRRLGVEKDT